MVSAAHTRWTVILASLALTVAAIFYPPANEVEFARVDKNVANPSTVRADPALAPKGRANSPKGLAAEQGPDWIATDEDPFAAHAWTAVPAPTQIAAPRAVEPVVLEEKPSPPPPLPYQFVGQMTDGGNQIVYLSRGDQVLVVRNGETVEGTYRVLDISATQVEFETLASGLRQTLPIPAQDL